MRASAMWTSEAVPAERKQALWGMKGRRGKGMGAGLGSGGLGGGDPQARAPNVVRVYVRQSGIKFLHRML